MSGPRMSTKSVVDTLFDTVQRGRARFLADGIPMRPQKVEYGTASCVHA
jgi:hypothetical protein